jgi:hypothetical protein
VYTYGIVDSLNTLLVREAMERSHHKLYEALGVPSDLTPTMAQTAGRRTADVLQSWAMSELELEKCHQREFKKLLTAGGISIFDDDPQLSRFGRQNGTTQGGLLYNRSSRKLWHESPGMLADIDLSGCYNAILESQNLYLGKPIVWEPGGDETRFACTLKDVVSMLLSVAPNDGWLVRVSGSIGGFPNTLVLSTLGATTNVNYKSKSRRRSVGAESPWYAAAIDDRHPKLGSKLFTEVIESGVITFATWTTIQAMPSGMRQSYENLQVDAVVFFVNSMIAENVEEFMHLRGSFRGEGPGWSQTFSESGFGITTHTRADEANVAIRVPVRNFAREVRKLRKQAREQYGKGHPLELAWKLIGNASFGVMASENLPTNNFLAANVITSTARACVWIMTQVLNGFQPITDGTVYRRDQIPAGTFAEVLEQLSDYPQHRAEAESDLGFLPVNLVPTEDAAFTAWYRKRAAAFFDTQNEDFCRLVSLHDFEHKLVMNKAGDKVMNFDAFIPFGVGDNIMLLADGDEWFVADVKLRSYGRESKAMIVDWILRTVQDDHYALPPPPVAEETHLLRYKEAAIRVRSSLATIEEVQFPLGYECRKTRKIALIRDSGFLFQSQKQWQTFKKAVAGFRNRTGSGLELLTLPAATGRRRSITDLLSKIIRTIGTGSAKFNALLNLSRLNLPQQQLAKQRVGEIKRLSKQAKLRFQRSIDASKLTALDRITGLQISRQDGQTV